MLSRAKKSLTAHSNTSFLLLPHANLEPIADQSVDFAYAFDVFPHVGSILSFLVSLPLLNQDIHTIRDYIREFWRILLPGGKALVHTSNLNSDAGWERFNQQKEFSVGGSPFPLLFSYEFLSHLSSLFPSPYTNIALSLVSFLPLS